MKFIRSEALANPKIRKRVLPNPSVGTNPPLLARCPYLDRIKPIRWLRHHDIPRKIPHSRGQKHFKVDLSYPHQLKAVHTLCNPLASHMIIKVQLNSNTPGVGWPFLSIRTFLFPQAPRVIRKHNPPLYRFVFHP